MNSAEGVRRAGTSFYWAMRLLPRAKREAMFALYLYCRAVDDVADGALPTEIKRSRLDDFRNAVAALYDGSPPAEATVAALEPFVGHFALPRTELEAVIDGMAMDVDGPLLAPDLATLGLYCRRVAGAVGMLAVRIFGRPDALALGVVLGEALQFTNILRDVAEDARLGRLYLPAEFLDQAGIAERDPAAVAAHPRLPEACAALARLAERRFAEAEAEMARLGRHGLWPARVMAATYHHQLVRLAAGGWRGPPPPRPGTGARLWIALKAAVAFP